MFAIPTYATVSATDTKRQFFTASGSGTTYTFTMPVNSEDDIRVQKRVTTTGVTTALTQDVDYTIASTGGDYLNGGVVTISPALAATFEVIVIREIVQTQETASGAVNAISIELMVDKNMRAIQDLRNDFDQRAVKLPESDSTSLISTLGDSVASANTTIGRDANGNITETVQAETSVSFSTFGVDFVALANAAAARDTLVLDTDDPVQFAAIVGTTGTFSAVITANDGVTLGDGDDLVGSATSVINMNAFDVSAAGAETVVSVDIGSTVVVVGVLDDDSMDTATDTTTATSESIKAYADAYIKLVDSKAATTEGGTFTKDVWQKRTVAQESDIGGHVAVSSSVIVLDAGTYQCRISCPAFFVDEHQTRLRNTTAGSTVLVGTSETAGNTNNTTTRSFITGIFTIAASQNLEIQHYSETTRATDGFGRASGNAEVEIYTIAEFWKR